MYQKLNIIHRHKNQVKIDFKLLLLQLFLDDRRWIHANPTLYSTGEHKDKFKKYYVEDGNFVDRFYEALIDTRRFVILRGKRGSGKTSFLNYFLNSKTRDLNSNGLTWVRIDTTKLYKNRSSFSKNIDFKTYLYGQLLFVYFRYKGQKESCDTVFKCPNGQFELESCDTVFHDVDLESMVSTLSNEMLDMYNKAKSSALETEHYNNSYDGKCFECNELGEILYKAVADKLIVIIDGIDNISYNSFIKHEVWGDLKSFLDDIKKANPLPHKIVLALRTENYTLLSSELQFLNIELLRSQNSAEESVPHFFDLDPSKLGTIIKKFKASIEQADISRYLEDNYTETLRIILKAYQKYYSAMIQNDKTNMSVKELMAANEILKIEIGKLDRKGLEQQFGKAVLVFDTALAIIIKKKGHSLSEMIEKALHFLLEEEKAHSKESFGDAIRTKVLTHYFEYAENFESFLSQTLKKRAVQTYSVHKTADQFDTIADMFNGDLREMFILSYRSYAYLINFSQRDKRLGHYRDIIHYMEGRDLSVLRAIFQNGNQYRGGREDIIFYPPYRNINFINLFNILDAKRQAVSPLALLYLLKYLYKASDTVENIEKKYQQSDIVESNSALIQKILNELLEFGYIGVVMPEDTNNTKKLFYKATPKGKNILDYSLTNLDIIQSYIYGGLVEERFAPLYRIWYDHNYASQLLFNVLLFWYELEEQEKHLSLLKKELGVELDIISKQAKKNFISLAKSFPEYHAMEDIDNYTKGDKSLAKELKALYRRITFRGEQFADLFEPHRDRLSEVLDQSERIVYVFSYLEKSPQEIVDHIQLHQFVFGDIEPNKQQERIETINSILKNNEYWGIRGELIAKLQTIKMTIFRTGRDSR